MLTRILLPGLLLLPQLALARNAGWFLKGAATVEIAGTVEVPLYRGTIGDHRPMIAVDREVDGKKRSVLAIVDVGMGWTTVGRDLAGELGIVPEATDLNGEWAQVATVDALSIAHGARWSVNPSRVIVLRSGETTITWSTLGHFVFCRSTM